MTNSNRNAVWKNIWTKKGLDELSPLHMVDGYDLLSANDYDHMVYEVTRPLGLSGNEMIIECGCGAGAFLVSLLKVYPELKVSGLDYSSTLIKRASQVINGDFFLADMTDLGFLAQAKYDATLSFGAIFYLSSKEAARRAVEEMLRITKPGGTVFIGEIPDAAKRDLAENIRNTSHQGVNKVSTENPDHLYLAKEFFKDIARENELKLKIIDHTEFDLGNYQAALYRYSVYLTK
jgi:ubiquinone/menaquinone biosynthesis C-methylase UbiE